MKPDLSRRVFSWAAIVVAATFFVACETEEEVPKAIRPGAAVGGLPDLDWEVSSRRLDDDSLYNDLSLQVNGRSYSIARNVTSLKGGRDQGKLRPGNRFLPSGALTGYFFDWHISGDTFYVKDENGALAVYRDSYGDENEGATTTSRVRTIRY